MTMTLFADPSGTLGKIQVNGVDVLEVASNPPRLRGDFSNATPANRLLFQTTTANSTSTLGFIPNGTGTQSNLVLYNNSDPANASRLRVSADAALNIIYSDVVGSGTLRPLAFDVGGEAMRIDTSRRLLLNETAVGAMLNIRGGTTAGQNDIGINIRNGADPMWAVAFKNAAGSTVGSISVTASATAYNTTSDPRLKNTITPLTGSGAIIDALNPVTWLWNSDGSPGAGFLAPQFQAVFPRAVTGVPDEVDVDLNPVYQMLDASTPEVMAVIVAELQDIRLRLAAGGL